MKKLPLIVILWIVYSAAAKCQTDTMTKKASVYPKLDTINYYLINSESMNIENGMVVYKVNDKIVTQEQWSKMTIGISKIKNCTPCMVRTYDANDTLVSVGVQYKRCDVGAYTGYYPDGRIKVTGEYKENTTGKWDKSALNNYCSKKEGFWTYYTESGKIKEIELYTDGKYVKKTPMK